MLPLVISDSTTVNLKKTLNRSHESTRSDVVEKEKRNNQCIVLADMCKDAFVTTDGGTMESDTTLRRNLLAMYERDTNYGLLEPFINELTFSTLNK